jgi:two-component system KDP operon response regulator KdpE
MPDRSSPRGPRTPGGPRPPVPPSAAGQPRSEGGGARILLVEDDTDTRRLVARNLDAHGYVVDLAPDGATALSRWEARRPDVVVLDLGLPDVDGLAIVRRVRREANTPILVLSARDREEQKVAALDLGADDYVTKPFGMSELHARLRALLRRAAGPERELDGTLAVGGIRIDTARHEVRVGEAEVHLTPREFELLRVLAMAQGRVVTHHRLLEEVWGRSYADEGHYLHVYVSQLRRKLDAADPTAEAGSAIVSEPGVGYRLVPSSPGP